MEIVSPSLRLKMLMGELGINQQDICDKTGLPSGMVSNYINGHRTPRHDKIVKIADAYKIDPTWLMGYDVPMYRDDMVGGIDATEVRDSILTADKVELIKMYEQLNSSNKSTVKKFMEYLVCNQ